jgi:hypothetical protein
LLFISDLNWRAQIPPRVVEVEDYTTPYHK